MKRYVISFMLLIAFICVGFYTFNFIDAWAGIFVTIASVGTFVWYVYTSVKRQFLNQKNNTIP